MPVVAKPKLSPVRKTVLAIIACLWLAVLCTWVHDFVVDFSIALEWMTVQKWMLLAFVLLCAGDDLTTEIAMYQTHGQGELNPAMNLLFKRKRGRLLAHGIKFIAVVFIVIVLASTQDDQALLFLTTVFGLVVVNNLRSVATYWLSPEFSTATRAVPTNNRVYLLRIAELVAIAAFITYGVPYIL